jgi:hypothetical protein
MIQIIMILFQLAKVSPMILQKKQKKWRIKHIRQHAM